MVGRHGTLPWHIDWQTYTIRFGTEIAHGTMDAAAEPPFMESMPWRFPMPMTIRCYACGKVFEVLLPDKDSHDYPCPACGKVEVFDLGE